MLFIKIDQEGSSPNANVQRGIKWQRNGVKDGESTDVTLSRERKYHSLYALILREMIKRVDHGLFVNAAKKSYLVLEVIELVIYESIYGGTMPQIRLKRTKNKNDDIR